MFDGRWRHAVDRGTKPVGRALVRAGITADVLTGFGLVMSVVTALVIGSGHLVIAIYLLFPTGLPDLFDGPVAKASGRASVRGAFLDSVADRISDAFLLGGVAWYLAAHHHGVSTLVPFGILAATSLISYQRAKAELLGLSARGGLMERAERFIGLGLCFIAGSVSGAAFVPALLVFGGLVLATATNRFVKVWAVAGQAGTVGDAAGLVGGAGGGAKADVDEVAPAGRLATATAPTEHSGHLAEVSRRALARWREGRVDTRWRAWREALAQRDGSRLGPGGRSAGRGPLDATVRRRVRRPVVSTGAGGRSSRIERRRSRSAERGDGQP